jgi:hypothetical protein
VNNNPCFRCGKQRKVVKTYTEMVDNSLVTYTDSVCPDPECQKALELQLKEEKEKRTQIATQKANQLESRLEEKRREKQALTN